MTTTTRVSLEQFLALPEQKPALELDPDGTIHEKMSPNTEHSALQAHIAYLLLTWVDVDPPRRRGYVYTELRTNLSGASRVPDVAFYRRRARPSDRKHALNAADVAIEILSPSDDVHRQQAKCRWYLEQGAQVALLIDPVARLITRYDRVGQLQLSSPSDTVVLLPDLQLTLAEVFSILDA